MHKSLYEIIKIAYIFWIIKKNLLIAKPPTDIFLTFLRKEDFRYPRNRANVPKQFIFSQILYKGSFSTPFSSNNEYMASKFSIKSIFFYFIHSPESTISLMFSLTFGIYKVLKPLFSFNLTIFGT